MDTKIRFVKTAMRPDEAHEVQFCVTLTQDLVQVAVGDTVRPSVPWDKLLDMDFVSDAFWMLRVWEFREVVQLLAKAHTARSMLEFIA